MRLNPFMLLLPMAAAAPVAAQDRAHAHQGAEPSVVTLCELLSVNPQNEGAARAVSITADAAYDFEHGYFLSDSDCESRDVFDGTGVIRIELPPRSSIEAFPELLKLADQQFLAANVGRHLYCACVGTIDYQEGSPRFVLSSARVWSELAPR